MGPVSSPSPVRAKFYLLQFIVVYKPSSFIHTFYFLRSFYWSTRCGIKSRANSYSTHVYTLSYENNHVPRYYRTITSTLYYWYEVSYLPKSSCWRKNCVFWPLTMVILGDADKTILSGRFCDNLNLAHIHLCCGRPKQITSRSICRQFP